MARDTILFDINETVLDLSSLKPKFEAVFKSSEVMPIWFNSLLHASTISALTDVKTTFVSLAGFALDNVAAHRNLILSENQRGELLRGFASLKPHCDIIPALATLRKAGYRTVAFSNSSLDLITNQINNAGLSDSFDKIISVEETGSFKPDRKVYEFAAAHLMRPIDELCLVATHDWDTHGAMVAGMQAAYIARGFTPYHPLFKKPDVYATDMNEIVRQIIIEDQRN